MNTPTPSVRPTAPLDIAALTRGDHGVITAVYVEHAPRLLRTLKGLLGDPTEAEDVLHDLFVGLPDALRRYEDRGRFGAWLNKVAVRLALQRLRSRKRRGEGSLDGIDTPSVRAEAEQIPDRLSIEAALAKLPDGQRTVVVLREIEGWTHNEIAAFLEIRVGAVMTRHCRAMQRLRLALEEDR